MSKITALFATLISAYFFPTTVLANCEVGGVDLNPVDIIIPARTIQVSPSLPVGTVLVNDVISTTTSFIRCTAAANLSTTLGAFADKNDTVANAYNTGVPGVGIIFEITKGDFLGVLPKYEDFLAGRHVVMREITYSLVKTGKMESGQFSGAGHELRIWGRRPFNITVDPHTVVASGCDVTQTLIPVSMPSAHISHFSGIGSRTDTVPFTIPLYCFPSTNVKFQIDATADSSGLPGVMRITPGRYSAKGVGIELRQDSKFVKFGVETSATGYQPGEYRDVPFTARYIQTEEEVEGGQANGTATFTMTYN